MSEEQKKRNFRVFMLFNGSSVITEVVDGVWKAPHLLGLSGDPMGGKEVTLKFMPFLMYADNPSCSHPESPHIITEYTPSKQIIVEFGGYMDQYEMNLRAASSGIIIPKKGGILEPKRK